MKKLLIFFILIFVYSCSNLIDQRSEIANIDCPLVFFSSENNIYVDGQLESIDLEKINYRASLNNYIYRNNCISEGDNNNYNLDILILIEPINPKSHDIKFPLFVLLYDANENLIGKQYFSFENKLNYDEALNKFKPSEIIVNLNIFLNNKERVSSIAIGFVKL